MKKIISIMLTIVMVISLFGCGNTASHDHEHETTAPVETTVTTEPAETTVPDETEVTEPVETTVPNETEGETETTVPDETEGTEPVVTEPVVNTQPVETEPAETTNKQESNEGDKSDDIVWTECNETVYATSTVNVRAGAGTSYDKLGSLSKGDSVKRTATGSNGWSRIEYNGKTAYVSSNYISTTKPATNTGSNSGNTENSDSGNSGSSNENTDDGDTGYYWKPGPIQTGPVKVYHDCATQGHKWSDSAKIADATCTTQACYEMSCIVVGCNATQQEYRGATEKHIRSYNDITGSACMWGVIATDGGGNSIHTFANEEAARECARNYAKAYMAGESNKYVTAIYHGHTQTVASDTYVCKTCGQTLTDTNYMWDGDPDIAVPDDGWFEYYDKNNQPT